MFCGELNLEQNMNYYLASCWRRRHACAREAPAQGRRCGVIEAKGKIVMDTSDRILTTAATRDLGAGKAGGGKAWVSCYWSMLAPIGRLDRYEQRLLTRSRWAIWEFCKTKPMDGSAIEPAVALPAIPGTAGDFCKTKPMPEVLPSETSAPEASEGIAQDFCKTKPIPAAQSSVFVPGENVSDNFCGTKPMAKSQEISTYEDEQCHRQAEVILKLHFLQNKANGGFLLCFRWVSGDPAFASPVSAGYGRGHVPS